MSSLIVKVVPVSSIRIRTEPNARVSAGGDIVVSVTLPDGREIDVIREFGAQGDIIIDHTVTANGVDEAASNSEIMPAPGQLGGNSGHGHVWKRPDGLTARCGGPGICAECSRDQARWNAQKAGR